jgi:Mce-associated membrane protein
METDPETGPETAAETVPAAPPARRRSEAVARLLVVVTATLALLLAAACVVVALRPTAVPGRSGAEKANDRDVAVYSAARKVTTAFLDVDYRDMDSRIDKVLDLSTGTFKNQYETARADLKAKTKEAKTMATGAVLDVGIGDIDDDNAVVYVAADSDVTNVSVQKVQGADAKPTRYYRFQLNLTKVGNRWLLGDLQFIS